MSLLLTIPSPVLADSTLGGSSLYEHVAAAYDYAINGLPFISGASASNPEIRKTAPYRKEGFDSSPEPGEHSLDFWWIKSQSTFHGGAGQTYIDTPVAQGNEIRPLRYQSSAGVNPWSLGKLSLLKTTSKAATTAAGAVCRVVQDSSGNNFILYSDGANLWRVQETVASGTPTYSAPVSVAWGGTGTIQSLTTDGAFYYVTDGTGIWKGDFTTPATAATKIYAMTSGTALLSWVKQRLMLAYTTSASSAVYELANTGSASALPTAKYSHPNSAWQWTALAEGPGAIYAAGYSGSQSVIFKFILNNDGTVPVLSTGVIVAEFSPGERVLALRTYLSSNIAIATTLGLRVGVFVAGVQTGDFQYGPITVPFTNSPTAASITGSDRFLYVTYTDSNGVAGLARADLSLQISIRPFSWVPDQRYAWAPDLRATDNSEAFVSGTSTAVDQIAGRMVFLVPNQGVFVEHPSKLTPSGTLTTSRLRYDSLDPKVVRYVRIRTEGADGTVSVAVNQNADSGGPTLLTDYPPTLPDSGDVPVSLSPLTFSTITFNFTRGSNDLTASPVLTGYQLKGLPAQKRQRIMQIPLLAFDSEFDSSGGQIGYPGSALSRLLALEALDATGDIVTFQVLSPWPDNAYSVLCVIEDVQFTQTSAPTDENGWGGIIDLTLRTVG